MSENGYGFEVRNAAAQQAAAPGTREGQAVAIYGALILYLDFINLFLYLLRLLGRRK